MVIRYPLITKNTSTPTKPPLNISNSSQLLSGKLRYGMVSYGFEMILKNDIFKFRIYIKDRELNTSNIIETPEVTLEEILSD